MSVRVKHDDAGKENTGQCHSVGVDLASDHDTLVIAGWRDRRLAGYFVFDSARPAAVHRVQAAGQRTNRRTVRKAKGAA
jgi:hypothetical protein